MKMRRGGVVMLCNKLKIFFVPGRHYICRLYLRQRCYEVNWVCSRDCDETTEDNGVKMM